MSVADPRVMYGAASNAGLLESFATMQNRFTGDRVIGILEPHRLTNSVT